MTEVQRIVDQYDRTMNGDAWHGDPVWKILEGITSETAARKPIPAAHSIWELIAHMTYWEAEVCRRLRDLPARPEAELNFPAAPAATAQNWDSALAEFRNSNTEFRYALSQLEDSQLDQPLSGPTKTIYVEAHGVIQHNLYPAGQIAILKRNSEQQ